MDLHTLADTAANVARAAVILRTPLAAIAILTCIALALDARAARRGVVR